MHMISTVDSELTSTCTGKENKTLVFAFDVFHRLHDEIRGKKRAFLFTMHQSLVSTVNCAMQILESCTSNASSFFMFIRKV